MLVGECVQCDVLEDCMCSMYAVRKDYEGWIGYLEFWSRMLVSEKKKRRSKGVSQFGDYSLILGGVIGRSINCRFRPCQTHVAHKTQKRLSRNCCAARMKGKPFPT